MPELAPLAPSARPGSASSTSARTPSRASACATAHPTTPPPITATRASTLTASHASPLSKVHFKYLQDVTLEELKQAVDGGAVDTVLLAITDMQGRLQGKRMMATHFLNEVLEHGAEGCNYLLAVDVDMNTVPGYAMSSWERGYGDMRLTPDLDVLRSVPWQEGTVICLADVAWLDGSDVLASPRQILRRQLERLADRGWTANAGTELEFMVFRDTYEEAWQKGYRDLRPANLYNVDYSLLGTARVEPLIRRIRNSMAGAGMVVEDSKGECNFGQHEINFRYADALRTADEHVIYRNGAKEIAAQEGMAISFMAKYDEREGNSCHIHFSLAGEDDGRPLFARDEATFHAFLAGQLNGLRELTLMLAPNVNSYKRYAPGSFAPTAVAWGEDNRTCALRVVGHGASLRFENRAGGSDLNPYMALSALIAAGLHGVDSQLELDPPYRGNAYLAHDKPRLPETLLEARDLFAASDVARAAFGEEVVNHYVNAADVELAAFNSAVTDWERFRGFERL
jgi:glutamine synthetase